MVINGLSFICYVSNYLNARCYIAFLQRFDCSTTCVIIIVLPIIVQVRTSYECTLVYYVDVSVFCFTTGMSLLLSLAYLLSLFLAAFLTH